MFSEFSDKNVSHQFTSQEPTFVSFLTEIHRDTTFHVRMQHVNFERIMDKSEKILVLMEGT